MGTIFYSWQSDLPNSTNRGFIEKAIGGAIQGLTTKDGKPIELTHSSRGKTGAVNIAETILSKIAVASVVVADVSIINSEKLPQAGPRKGSKRPTPNPNVLFELGYAVARLGDSRTIMVMNTAFGGPAGKSANPQQVLPFDLGFRAVITYDYRKDGVKKIKAEALKFLTSRLRSEIEAIVALDAAQSSEGLARIQLFQERYQVYESLLKFIAVFTQKFEINSDATRDFNIARNRAEFLFKDEFSHYLKQIYELAVDIYSQNREIDALNTKARATKLSAEAEKARRALIKKNAEDIKRFTDQLSAAKVKFKEYIDLSTLK